MRQTLVQAVWADTDPRALCPAPRVSAIRQEVVKGLMTSSKASSTCSDTVCTGTVDNRDSNPGCHGLTTDQGQMSSQLNCGCDRTPGFLRQ